MNTSRVICFVLTLVTCLLAPSAETRAQDWDWPEKPQNLQVLPKDWPGQRLSPVMRGFSRALGVRCSHCHVGEEGKSLATYDFASDANPNKGRARVMLNMLGDIGKTLDTIEPSGDRRVNMWCHTCHRGRPRPMTLDEELSEVYRKSGHQAAIAHYRELKDKYYGKGAYAFGERPLNSFGYSILREGDHESAIAVFQLSTSEFPDSANAWDSLAEAYLSAGNRERATTYYRKSLELDPKNANAAQKLEELEKEPEE